MKTAVKIYRSDFCYNFDSLQLLEKSPFPSLLENFDSKNKLEYALLIDPENLFYSVKLPELSNYDKTLKQGQFQADLWKQDLTELFIASDEGNEYQEINLAPSGAYWTVKFSDYRARISESEVALPGIAIEIRTTILGKILSLKIPLSSLITGCSFTEKSKINCCAIVGANPRNFYSTSFISPEKPDFHNTSAWGELKAIKL